jgi:adenosylcobinamide kinase/adenosylcobinamide-phosphate guanylyltransferase
MATVVLVLGGSRSGKSEVAERRAAELAGDGPVTYVATGWAPDGSDPSWQARVAAHQLRRPPTWTTVEAGPDLAAAVVTASGVVLVDSLGTWVSGADGFAVDVGALVDVLVGRDAPTVLVSDEVGLGVHPETALGVAFRDALGDANRAVAAAADEVLLVVAGRVLPLG